MANGGPTPRRRGLAVELGFAAASGTRNAGLPIRAEGMVKGRAVTGEGGRSRRNGIYGQWLPPLRGLDGVLHTGSRNLLD